MNNPECIFCAVPHPNIVLERPLVFVRLDGYPVSKGHCLVIPRRHVASFFECTREERAAMLELLDEAKAMIDREHGPSGYNIGINDRAAAGQTVMHVHMHLIPRYAGDAADPRGGVRWVIPDKAAYWRKP